MGRPKSKNAKERVLGVRLDEATFRALDREIDREVKAKPGLLLTRSGVARILLAEALLARSKRRPR